MRISPRFWKQFLQDAERNLTVIPERMASEFQKVFFQVLRMIILIFLRRISPRFRNQSLHESEQNICRMSEGISQRFLTIFHVNLFKISKGIFQDSKKNLTEIFDFFSSRFRKKYFQVLEISFGISSKCYQNLSKILGGIFSPKNDNFKFSGENFFMIPEAISTRSIQNIISRMSE